MEFSTCYHVTLLDPPYFIPNLCSIALTPLCFLSVPFLTYKYLLFLFVAPQSDRHNVFTTSERKVRLAAPTLPPSLYRCLLRRKSSVPSVTPWFGFGATIIPGPKMSVVSYPHRSNSQKNHAGTIPRPLPVPSVDRILTDHREASMLKETG